MLESEIAAGDIVQATEEITEPRFNGAEVWIHARAGGIGHVLDAARCSEPGWWIVLWERTGTVVDTHSSQFKRLAAWDVGRAPG